MLMKRLLIFLTTIIIFATCTISIIVYSNSHDYHLISLILDSNEIDMPGVYLCDHCGGQEIRSISQEDVNIPIISFSGDMTGISKENNVKISVYYKSLEKDIDCDATLKWQGASSLSYPKKNFTIKFLEKGTSKKYKVELKDGWGKQDKYCLKANYIDFSQARNVVSGQIYSQVVKSRNLEDEIEQLVNGGAVDGFPTLIYINGAYQGLYTLNIPKDKWMFGMEDDKESDETITKQALLMGDDWTDGALLKEIINDDFTSSGFELEYCSTEDTIGNDWVVESFNAMIDFVNNNDGEAFREGISNYVCLDRTIDSILYTWLINANDNTAKNILWTTYDGLHWFSSMYDMDGTWGISWNGMQNTISPQNFWNKVSGPNNLWVKILENFQTEIRQRYLELRLNIFSAENLKNSFREFMGTIPSFIYESDKAKWTESPSIKWGTLEYIENYIDMAITTIDNYFN